MTYSKLISYEHPGIMPSSDRGGRAISKIVIHHNATTNPDVAMNTWINGQTSAHYEITDMEIIGCVPEELAAWHAGNFDVNQTSIGLEHLNSTGAPDWGVSNVTLKNSASLIADICNRYGLPIDNTTIVPHRSIVATACPGGIDMDKLIRYAQEVAGAPLTPIEPPRPTSTPKPVEHAEKGAIKAFMDAGNQYTFYKPFRVDELEKVNGIWQVVNYELAGGTDFDWINNGIPVEIIDKVDSLGNKTTDQLVNVGDFVKIMPNFNHGTIDVYDEFSDGVGIIFGGLGVVWFNASALLKY